jgi:hypothetical protein
MRRMDVDALQHLAHMRLEMRGEADAGRGSRGTMYAGGPHRARRRWRISTEQERLGMK